MTHKIIQYFKRQIQEIGQSIALRGLGIGLSLTHTLTVFHWYFGNTSISGNPEREFITCWGFAPNCADFRQTLVAASIYLGWIYLISSLVTALLFISRKTVGVAYALLIGLTTFKMFLYVQDFVFMGNYHYMPFFLTAVFLFVPEKLLGTRLTMIGFYISAGLIKLNKEWLGGDAIPPHWIMAHTPMDWIYKHGLLPLSCLYVVILETIFVFGLLSKNKWIFWITTIEFTLFHIASYWIVLSYYPLNMAAMFIVFPLYFLFERNRDIAKNNIRDYLCSPAYLSLAVLFALQMLPRLSGPDPAITGEGRAFSLNMFDALTVCSAKAIAEVGSDFIEVTPPRNVIYGKVRKQCDPLVYFDHIRDICKAYQDTPNFKGIRLGLISRRTSDIEYKSILELPNACLPTLSYSHFGFNDWIQK